MNESTSSHTQKSASFFLSKERRIREKIYEGISPTPTTPIYETTPPIIRTLSAAYHCEYSGRLIQTGVVAHHKRSEAAPKSISAVAMKCLSSRRFHQIETVSSRGSLSAQQSHTDTVHHNTVHHQSKTEKNESDHAIQPKTRCFPI